MAIQISISNAIGSRYRGSVVPPVDPDAQAFITAAAITDPTQQAAINTLVVDLKGYNIWTKMKALYPFVGGTASSHKFNLKDPRDLDAAFRLVFNGGWTHSANGALPNGTNAFADTKFQPSNSDYTNFNWGYYLRTNSISGNEFGVSQGIGIVYDYPKLDTNGYLRYGGGEVFVLGGDTRGLYSLNQASNQLKRFRNGVLTNTWSNSIIDLSTNVLINYYIAARNNNGTASNFSNRERAFQYISDGLTDTEAANFYTAVQTFQTTLGRSIGTQTVSDADAQAFVTNAGIVDQVEANAINNLVIGMKADGIWTKMKAVYPMVGGSSSTMKYNLKNPLDTDAAFRLVFSGGWTHSNTGATPNGTNAYASTKLNAKNILTNNNTHLSFYSRTSTISNVVRDMGAFQDGGNPGMSLGTNTGVWISDQNDFNIRISSSIASATGFYTGTRTTSTNHKLYKNGSVLGTNTNTNSQILPENNLFISAVNISSVNNESPSSYSNKQCAFASIGDGLTDTDATNLYTRVQNFNTALARQV